MQNCSNAKFAMFFPLCFFRIPRSVCVFKKTVKRKIFPLLMRTHPCPVNITMLFEHLVFLPLRNKGIRKVL